jgi:hypothetical protein
MFVKDRTAVKGALETWSKLPDLQRLVPFHGAVVEKGAASALGSAASVL